jgi:predicted lipoprotein with Yx(FWY)xxD motif
MNPKIGKNILVDAKGLTLYTFDADTTAGKSVCNAGCDTKWPPLTVTGTPSYGDKLAASMFSTFTRDDGSTQLSVNGHPLYHFANDGKAGDTKGNGIGNVWYVVGADGKKIDNS